MIYVCPHNIYCKHIYQIPNSLYLGIKKISNDLNNHVYVDPGVKIIKCKTKD